MARNLVLIFFFTVACIVFGSGKKCFADSAIKGSSQDDFFGHKLQRYGNVIQPSDTDDTLFLTKDSVEKVRLFFEQTLQNGDRVDLAEVEGMSAYKLVYAGPEVQEPRLLASFEERVSNTNIHPALGELKAQAMMGKHSMQEYEALENKYRLLHLAFFKIVDDGQGRAVSEGEKIYRATYEKIHGPTEAAMESQAPTQSQKAEAAALKQQMQALKAKGDIAGMMKMAGKFSADPGQTAPGATAMKAVAADTWDAWVRCLQDIEAVAYRTRISYSAAAWK